MIARGTSCRRTSQRACRGCQTPVPKSLRVRVDAYTKSLARSPLKRRPRPAGAPAAGRTRMAAPMIAPLDLPRRYLVAFDPRDLPHHFTDVLVIGGGLAGLRAALGVPEPLRVLVVTKDEVRESNSAYAQGGIAGVLDPEDHFEDHIADTLAAGKGLCDPEVVAMVVREAPGGSPS